MRKDFSPQELEAFAANYEAKPVTEARNDMGQLCDQVSYRQKRVVLTKHDKPVAVLVPLEDLASLHAADLAHFAYMAAEADRNRADEDETLTLEEAAASPPEATGGPPGVRIPFVRRTEPIAATLYEIISDACRPVVVANLETTIAEGVFSKLSGVVGVDAINELRVRIRAGVHQALEQTQVADLAGQSLPEKMK